MFAYHAYENARSVKKFNKPLRSYHLIHVTMLRNIVWITNFNYSYRYFYPLIRCSFAIVSKLYCQNYCSYICIYVAIYATFSIKLGKRKKSYYWIKNFNKKFLNAKLYANLCSAMYYAPVFKLLSFCYFYTWLTGCAFTVISLLIHTPPPRFFAMLQLFLPLHSPLGLLPLRAKVSKTL